MRKYENHVQKIKSQVYQKVSEYAFEGNLAQRLNKIPEELNVGPNPSLRCCVYHERAVTAERVQMAMGGDQNNPNLVEVLYAACDQCTENRYVVNESCRGCIAHRCQQSCPVNAISFINNKAIIDYQKCIECGKCHAACPYNAISDVLRPCIKACPVNAIQMDEHKKAIINEGKCIRCGACVYSCPFGAVQDKSQIVQVIEAMKKKENAMYAIFAPSIASQFEYKEIGQIVTALKTLGFKDVIEVALGADLVAVHEAEEFVERMEEGEGFMTSSCCPGFVRYIHQEFPELKDKISTTISPMVATARLIKKIDAQAKVVFAGPCIAKKGEEEFMGMDPSVDYVLTFEELSGMVMSQGIVIEELEAAPLNNASDQGRGFASSGGVTMAVIDILKDTESSQKYETLVCNGIAECKKALTLGKLGRLKNTFIEGMACEGGCIKGPATMHYGATDKKKLDLYCSQAYEKSSKEAVRVFETYDILMHR